MSLERIINALLEMGLTRIQAEVYVYLAKNGPKTIDYLIKTLIYNRREIEHGLKMLQSKGILTRNKVLFCALPFEQTLILLIETRKEQAQDVTNKKEELLASWKKEEKN